LLRLFKQQQKDKKGGFWGAKKHKDAKKDKKNGGQWAKLFRHFNINAAKDIKKDLEQSGSGSGPHWHQLWDENHGRVYFVHSETGESTWEQPDWLEQVTYFSGGRPMLTSRCSLH
jgi:hypothetical protein